MYILLYLLVQEVQICHLFGFVTIAYLDQGSRALQCASEDPPVLDLKFPYILLLFFTFLFNFENTEYLKVITVLLQSKNTHFMIWPKLI